MRFNPFKLKEPGGRAVYRLHVGRKTRRELLANLLVLGWFISPTNTKPGWFKMCGQLFVGHWLVQFGRKLNYSRQHSFEQRTRLLQVANLQADLRTLEVGCRDGFLTIGAVRSVPGLAVVAVDNWHFGGSEEAIRSNTDLEEVGGRVRIYEANPWQLPFAEAEFDRIITHEYLANFRDTPGQIGRILAEFRRVLKPTGSLVLGDSENWVEQYAAELEWAGFSGLEIIKPASSEFWGQTILRTKK